MTAQEVRAVPHWDLPTTEIPLGAARQMSGTHDLRDGLFHPHREELVTASAIDADVMRERGYTSVSRPSRNDSRPRERLCALGIPSWAIDEDRYFPGLLIPLWDASGRRVSHQWKPRVAVANRDGKYMKYASVKGRSAVLDVHPRWTRDRGQDDPALVPYIRDIATPLFLTEGVKKADAMTSRGWCTVALSGVFNWRSTLGTLGDWEDIPIKGRTVTIVFDADTRSNPNVMRAMQRLGRWLRDVKQAEEVFYLITPASFRNQPTKGVDDYFAAGGTTAMLESERTKTPPTMPNTTDEFTDARMAETVADDALTDEFVWNRSLGWLGWEGRKWADASDEAVVETIRKYTLSRFTDAVRDLRAGHGTGDAVDGWHSILSAGRIKSATSLTRGIVEMPADRFDADPAVFNARNGLLDLDSGLLRVTEPRDHVTKVAGATYDPDARSDLWEAFIKRILPDEDVRAFVQRLLGYAMLGVVREHVMPIFTGEGANGKGTLRDAVLAAFGDYATEVDPELLMASHNPRHLTFLMELRGRRLVFCSETERGRRFAESTMKRLVGGDPIQANRMHKDPITFLPSHTLVMCTNHLPLVSGDDEALWRRLLVVPFDVVIPKEERDGSLPGKLSEPHNLAAVLAWVHRGYRAYLDRGLDAPEKVRGRTATYRTESDVIGRFLAECVEFGTSLSESAAVLFTAYETFTRVEGEQSVTKTEFGKEMSRRSYESVKRGGMRIYSGLMVSKSEEPKTGHDWSDVQ